MSCSKLELESDSEQEVHPNIDARSFRNWKRRQREEKKKKLEERLQEIESMQDPTEEDVQEKKKIEELLKPQYKCVGTDSFRTPSSSEKGDYVEELEYLIAHSDLNSFIELMNGNRIEMDELEHLILYNLAEQIKRGNDSAGFVLTKLSIYVRYAISHGKKFLSMLNAQLTDKNKMQQFDTDCLRDFEATKKNFLEYTSGSSQC